jgi:hypothetical protein
MEGFFFEKKNQKTFARSGVRRLPGARLKEQKFLLLFSKRSAFRLPLQCASPFAI